MTSQSDSKTPVVRQMLRRGAVLAAIFGVGAFAVLLARLYHIQITDHSFYEDLAISQQLREAPGTTRRTARPRRRHGVRWSASTKRSPRPAIGSCSSAAACGAVR